VLLLTRRSGEEIVVAVLDRFRDQTRIGIKASKGRYSILRREVIERDRVTANG